MSVMRGSSIKLLRVIDSSSGRFPSHARVFTKCDVDFSCFGGEKQRGVGDEFFYGFHQFEPFQPWEKGFVGILGPQREENLRSWVVLGGMDFKARHPLRILLHISPIGLRWDPIEVLLKQIVKREGHECHCLTYENVALTPPDLLRKTPEQRSQTILRLP